MGGEALATLLTVKQVVADFESIEIRDGLETPNTAHDFILWGDHEQAPILLIPETGVVELPFEHRFRRELQGNKVAAIGNIGEQRIQE